MLGGDVIRRVDGSGRRDGATSSARIADNAARRRASTLGVLRERRREQRRSTLAERPSGAGADRDAGEPAAAAARPAGAYDGRVPDAPASSSAASRRSRTPSGRSSSAPGRSGMILWPGSPRCCAPDVAAQIGAALRRRDEVAGVFVNAHLDEVADAADAVGLTLRPAPRRRGPGVLRGGRSPHRLQGDQGGARRRRCRRAGRCAPSTPTSTCSTRAVPGARAAPGRRSTGSSCAAPARLAADPRGGLTPENVGDAIAAVEPFAVDVASGIESEPGRQGPRAKLARVLRGGRAAPDAARAPRRARRGERRMSAGVEHRFGPYGGQYVPETLMPGARRARGGLAGGARATPPSGASSRAAARLRRPPDAAVPRRAPARGRRPRGLPQARGPQPHRRAQDQQRARPGAARASGWASRASSPRPAPASTASRPRPRARCSGSSASSTWAPRTCAASSRTSSGWSCSARGRAGRGRHAHAQGGRSAAIRDWVTNVATTHYMLGSAVGPAPYPALVRDLQRVIGDEARAQMLEREGRLPAPRRSPASAAARTRSARSPPFVDDADVELIGVEAAGEGSTRGRHGAPLTVGGRPACCTAPLGGAAGRRRPDPRGALGLGRARLPGRRPRARLAARHRPRPLRGRHRRRGARRAAAASRGWRGSSRRSSPRTRSRGRSPNADAAASSTSSASPAAATRTSPR